MLEYRNQRVQYELANLKAATNHTNSFEEALYQWAVQVTAELSEVTEPRSYKEHVPAASKHTTGTRG